MQPHLSTRILWTVGIFYAILALLVASFAGYFFLRAVVLLGAKEVHSLVESAEGEAVLLAASGNPEAVQPFLNSLLEIGWVEYALFEEPSGTLIATKIGAPSEVIDLLHAAGIGMANRTPEGVSAVEFGLLVHRFSHDLATHGIAAVGVDLLHHSVIDVARLEPTGSQELHIGVTRPASIQGLISQLLFQTTGIILLFGIACFATCTVIRRTSRPLTLLAREVRHIKTPEVATSVAGGGKDELSLLAGTVRSVAMELQVASQKLDESTSHVEVRSQALEYARSHIRAVMNLVTDGFLFTDSEGVVTEVNSQLSRLLGVSGEGMIGVACRLSPAAALAPLVTEALARPGFRPVARVGLASGGPGAGCSTALLLEREGVARIPALVGAVVRLTDESRAILIEERLLAQLEQVWSQLGPIASALAEEGRRGLELILRDWRLRFSSWGVEQQESCKLLEDDLSQMVSQCAQLTRGFRNGLTLTSLRFGKLAFTSSRFPVTHLIHCVSAEIERQFPGHEVRFFSRIEEGLPQIVGDLERLVDLMINLVAHSYSIADHGSVVCTAYWKRGALCLGVEDTGAPLRAEERLFLFDPIEYDEITVGLLLVREICNHYGSTMRTISHPGRGNQYEFALGSG